MLPHESIGGARAGAACVAAAGVLIPVSTLLRGPFVDPSTDAAGFATWVTGPTYLPAGVLFVVGLLFQIFGVLALYLLLARGRAPRLALVGTVFTLVTDALMLLALGVFSLALPAVGRLYLDGHPDVLPIATSLGGAFIGFQATQAVALIVGTVATAWAIARTPEIPAWCGPAYGVSSILIALSPPLPFLTELPCTVVFGITYLVLARNVWHAAWGPVRGA